MTVSGVRLLLRDGAPPPDTIEAGTSVSFKLMATIDDAEA